MKKEEVITSPLGESKKRSDIINTLIKTENEYYVIIPSILEGRKILITKELASKIELEWENGNSVLLKWNGGSLRDDNVYLSETIDVEIENLDDNVFTSL